MSKKNNDGHFGGSVGHKNPPKSGQFKKGQSGNPKGRPKKERDQVSDMIERVFFAEQTITIAGEPKKVAAIEVMLMRLLQQSQQGNERSISLAVKLMDKYGFTEQKLQIIPPFVPSRGELAKDFRDEMDDDYVYDE